MTTVTSRATTATTVADQIAKCALHHYEHELPTRGKPQPHEWTVFAAFVARCTVKKTCRVVSSATGTKCTAIRQEDSAGGCIVHDSHAEVLARRGLLRVLWAEIKRGQGKAAVAVSKNNVDFADNLLVPKVCLSTNSSNETTTSLLSTKVKYELNPNIELHLYISDSPCGDASIYEIPVERRKDCEVGHHDPIKEEPPNFPPSHQELLFTGAKVIVSETTGVNASDCGGHHQILSLGSGDRDYIIKHEVSERRSMSSQVSVAREEQQVLGKLRTKAGRSNLPDHLRSASMSCSDKLVLWSVMGVQGALLTGFLDDPPVIPIASIVVGLDARLKIFPTDGIRSSAISGESSDCIRNSQYVALERAISKRARKVLNSLHSEANAKSHSSCHTIPPTVHITDYTFAAGKSSMAVDDEARTKSLADGATTTENRKRRRDGECCLGKSKPKFVPCGVSINWNEADSRISNEKSRSTCVQVEVLVGARGIQQGKRPKSPKDYENLASRLSRSRLVQDLFDQTAVVDEYMGRHWSKYTYQDIKRKMSCSRWLETKSKILEDIKSPLAGWIRSCQDDNFIVSYGKECPPDI